MDPLCMEDLLEWSACLFLWLLESIDCFRRMRSNGNDAMALLEVLFATNYARPLSNHIQSDQCIDLSM